MEKSARPDWTSIAQLVFSILVVAVSWSLAAGIIAYGTFRMVDGSLDPAELLPIFLMSVSFSVCGLFMLPSAYYALGSMLGRPVLDSRKIIARLHPAFWIFGLPVVVIIGHSAATKSGLTWLLLPPLHMFAVGIPTAWILYLAIRKLPVGSSRRMWAVFGGGISLGPALIMLFEVLAAIGLLLFVLLVLSSQPGMMDKLIRLASQLKSLNSQDAVLEMLSPLLVRPAVIGIALLFGAFLVPVIEEIIKPIGVWLLLGQGLSPAAGFTAGAISGGGYAFIESLALSGSGEQWSAAVLARAGTTAVHIFTAALTGWALVQIRKKRGFLRLLLAYAGAVLIHGLWNGLTLLFSFHALAEAQGFPVEFPLAWGITWIAPAGLILLGVGCFFGLIAANKTLRRAIAPPAIPELPEASSEMTR